ncbi:hypothetical protein GXB85_13685 [Cellulomonas sp. APG4]|uniref:hypothetical protein n=1 Tax=Cellulomonas sp. APG4 TaxID=1538656 RepID=UPI0013794E0B|nr:hypothetical protein [Cellulomonas sp. APG4]NCT91994.1 hypothetical protein [Cellulomonas sp. APG4]
MTTFAIRNRGSIRALSEATGWTVDDTRTVLCRDVREATGWRSLTPNEEHVQLRESAELLRVLALHGAVANDFMPDRAEYREAA